MTRAPHMARTFLSLAALLLAGAAMPAQAQFSGPEADNAAASPDASASADGSRAGRGDEQRKRPKVDVSPYLEVGQILSADLKNGGDVLTYTSVAVGVDANIVTRRAELAASLRYEHRFGLSDGLGDQDNISGVLRGRIEAAQGLNLEAGALASRTSADGQGADNANILGFGSNVAKVYSIYAGPTLTQRIGGLDVGAGYRFGYTKVDIETPPLLAPGAPAQDIFDESTNHAAWASVGQRPGRLPFGWQLSGGYEREDASQLDQRYEGKYARADVTVPLSPNFALIGGVGYEDISLSQRDPLIVAGVPVRDADGRFVTDPNSPRQLAFETEGLIWDAGVMWRPSRRTSLTAKIGRRYDDTIYTGSFSYRADHATLVQIGVYNGISSFGRQLSSGLAALPTQFDPTRNPIDGSIGDCVFGQQGSGCLSPALGSATGAQFRSRGVQALYSTRLGGWNFGLGAGYDQRRLLAPQLSILFGFDGVTDENYYLAASLARQIDRDSDLSFAGYVNHFDNGSPGAADVQGAGASAVYSRRFWRGLTGSAAASISSFDQDGFNSQLIGSALLGLRYNF